MTTVSVSIKGHGTYEANSDWLFQAIKHYSDASTEDLQYLVISFSWGDYRKDDVQSILDIKDREALLIIITGFTSPVYDKHDEATSIPNFREIPGKWLRDEVADMMSRHDYIVTIAYKDGSKGNAPVEDAKDIEDALAGAYNMYLDGYDIADMPEITNISRKGYTVAEYNASLRK